MGDGNLPRVSPIGYNIQTFLFSKERTTDNILRIGVISAGQIGQVHLDNYKTIPEVEVVAIADMNKAHARSVAGRHGIPGIYADFHELLARRDIQAVDVCLHNNLHMACQRGRPRSRQTRLP